MSSTGPLPPHSVSLDPSRAFARFAASVLRIAAGVAVPLVLCLLLVGPEIGMNHFQRKGAETKCLAQARQIGLALRLYADDHQGVYPGRIDAFGETIQTANDAYRILFPNYTQSESIFGNRRSAWETSPPDNISSVEWPKILSADKKSPVGDKSGSRQETLRPGENVYGYIAGASNDVTPPNTPLVIDGTDGTGRGTYVSDPKRRGGVWSGARAIVICQDGSGALDILDGPPDARVVIGTLPDGTKGNLLSPAALGPDLHLLDPAIPGK